MCLLYFRTFKCNFEPGSGWKIFKGFLPVNKEIFKESMALFLSCAIVGLTVMPLIPC